MLAKEKEKKDTEREGHRENMDIKGREKMLVQKI